MQMLQSVPRVVRVAGVLVFLLISLGVTTFLVLNSNFSFDSRSRASEDGGEDASAFALQSIKDNLFLPSVLGFQTSLLTGDAEASYSFSTPDGPGGLKPNLGLSYSSSLIADWGKGFGLGAKANFQYIAQASPVGFGWNMTGVGSITKVRVKKTSNPDEYDMYALNLGGASYKLIKTPKGWRTSPEAFLKIEHTDVSCLFNNQKTSNLDLWKVTDTKGTVFTFGDDIKLEGNTCKFASETGASVANATAMRYRKEENANTYVYEPHTWMLRKVQDVHQNIIRYVYTQEVNISKCDRDGLTTTAEEPVNYTSSVLLDTVTYGSSNEFQIKLNYENRPDYKDERNDTSVSRAEQLTCQQYYFSKKRVDTLEVKVNGSIRNTYDLEFANDGPKFKDGFKFSHSLLKKITMKGVGGKKAMPPYTLSYYAYANAPNLLLLKTADNGQGGKTTYTYQTQKGTRCRINGTCVTDASANRLAVVEKVVEDSVTKTSYKTTYEYDQGQGIFETVNRFDPKIFDGYQFLGFKKVAEKTSKNNSSDPARIARTEFFLSQEREGTPSEKCFNPNKYYGKIKSQEILGTDGSLTSGSVLSTIKNSYVSLPFDPPECENLVIPYQQRILPVVALSKMQTTIDGQTQEVRYQYDSFGNQMFIANLGYIDSPGDESFTHTRYTYNLQKNILTRPYLSAVSYDPEGRNIVSIDEFYYDNNPNLTDPPQKGDLTKKVSGAKNSLASLSETYTKRLAKQKTENQVVLAATDTQINIRVKEGSVLGPKYSKNNKTVELYKIVGTCNQKCNASCQDKVCKKKTSLYDKKTGIATFPKGTDGASYVFGISNLDPNWKQDVCSLSQYPTNTSCTIVVYPPNTSPSVLPSSIPTSTATAPTPIISQPPQDVIPTPATQLGFEPLPPLSINPPPPLPIAQMTTTYEYDLWGNQIKTTNSLNQSTITSYDQTHTLPTQITNPLGWTKSTLYDPIVLKPIKETDFNGAMSETEYDSFGRITKMYGATEPKTNGVPTVIVSYQDENMFKVSAEVLKDKNPKTYLKITSIYNGLGQEIQQQKSWASGKIQVSDTRFNSLGNIEYSSFPYLIDGDKYGSFQKEIKKDTSIQYVYDMIGRQIKTVYPDNTEEKTQYSGKATTVIDRNGSEQNRTVSTFDGLGRTIKIEEFGDNTVLSQQYSFDPIGRILNYTDPGNHTTTNNYDTLGRLVQTQDPDRGKMTYSYDSIGNILSQTDNKNQTVQLSYDGINRVIKKSFPNNTQTQFVYDEGNAFQKGKLTTVLNNSSKSSYVYNEKGLPIRKEISINGYPTSFITTSTYDNLGFPKTVEYPEDHEVVTYTYNEANHLVKIKSTLGEIVKSITYSPTAQVKEITFANNSQIDNSYDEKNLRQKAWKYTADNKTLLDKSYEYDKVGNIVKILDKTSADKSIDYAYDQFYRLKSSSGDTNSQYSYDNDGNITTKKESQENISLTYDPSSTIALHAPKNINGNAQQYDNNGNLLIDSSQQLSITYDPENRPTQIENKENNTKALLYYDGQGQRVKKEVYTPAASTSPQKTYFYVDGKYEVELTSTNEKMIRKYYNNYAFRENDKLQFIASDYLKSTRITTDGHGNIVVSLNYYPYGNPTSQVVSPPPNTWIGEKLDTESGLYYLNNRYYNPFSGRFIQPDSVDDPLSRGNRYMYGGNSPVMYPDPNGNCASLTCVVDIVAEYGPKILGVYGKYSDPVAGIAGVVSNTNSSADNPVVFSLPLNPNEIAGTVLGVDSIDVTQNQYDSVKDTITNIVGSVVAEKAVTVLAAEGVIGVSAAAAAPATIVVGIMYATAPEDFWYVGGDPNKYGEVMGAKAACAWFGACLPGNQPFTPTNVSSAVAQVVNNVVEQANANNGSDTGGTNDTSPAPQPAPTPGPQAPPPQDNPPPAATPAPPPPDPGGGGAGPCFTKDTQISVKDGGFKNIQDIQVGDKILTRQSDGSKKLVEAKVSKLYTHTTSEYLIINKQMKVTPNHRIFINNSWVQIGQAKIGDQMTDINGNTIEIESIEKVTSAKKDIDVYNLEVEVQHTYFAENIYVHNMKVE